VRFYDHIHDKINKASIILGSIKKNFRHFSYESIVLSYKSLIRPHLDYVNSVLYSQRLMDIEKLEKVQMRATKLMATIRHFSYEETSLKLLKLPCNAQM
jgi:hypothetical protein